MKVYYHLSHYISHRTAGKDYIEALQYIGCDIIKDLISADVIILHDDPLNYHHIISNLKLPSKKMIIAYSVWETEKLPIQYIDPLNQVNEIWTCSDFSSISFFKHFKHVKVIPHIVSKKIFHSHEMVSVKKIINYSKCAFYFYTVIDSINPRKNISGLLNVFLAHFGKEHDTFLVIKQYREILDLSSFPKVISINNNLLPGEMAALHELCDCYVSLHHAEAWGLCISEALSAGNPVIATGYSGNMHYMDEDNSFPVRYTLGNVSREMCKAIPLYTEDMTWAYPDLNHAAYLMKKVVRMRRDAERAEKVKQSMKKFRMENVSKIIHKHLCK